MAKYVTKTFDTFYDLTKFLNENDIVKDEIVNISVWSRGVTLIYISEESEW